MRAVSGAYAAVTRVAVVIAGTTDTAHEEAPHGPSHIAPIAMQLFEAIARGAESTQTTIATTATAARNSFIVGHYNTQTLWSRSGPAGYPIRTGRVIPMVAAGEFEVDR
jgi:hypothetical protein